MPLKRINGKLKYVYDPKDISRSSEGEVYRGKKRVGHSGKTEKYLTEWDKTFSIKTPPQKVKANIKHIPQRKANPHDPWEDLKKRKGKLV